MSFYICNPHPRIRSLILERGRDRKRNMNVREKHELAASRMHPNQGSNPQPGICPDQEPNPQDSGIQDDAPIE